jgi:hypothetical protein
MAKRNAAPPAIADVTEQGGPAGSEVSRAERQVVDVTIAAPILSGKPVGYVTNHVETQLDGPQALALRRLQDALDQQGVRLASGLRVQTAASAVRWLLEQMPDLG